MTDALLATAKDAVVKQATTVVAQGKQDFLATFGSYLQPGDLLAIGSAFDKAAEAKIGQFLAKTPEAAQEQADIYEACLDTIETIGDDYEIVGKAKAGVLIRSVAHQVISGVFAVAGAVMQAALGVVVPGVGSLIGAGLNAGIQHVVSYFLED